MVELGVNIDHVATLRQARKTYEPDPVWAAAEAELGGADGITVHLREDRRHINDRDVRLLRQTVQCKVNLEMSLAAEIIAIAAEVAPDQATLVPERREEVTTEGGLDVTRDPAGLRAALDRLRDAGIRTSLFIDPDAVMVKQSRHLGADAIELHTGRHAHHANDPVTIAALREASTLGASLGLAVHAGHGLTVRNVAPVAAIPECEELNIGHSIVSRAVFVGIEEAVREMRRAMEAARRPP
jgi:pyridoxine 5-phosphate synthase